MEKPLFIKSFDCMVRLVHVKHYKLITWWDNGRMAAKKESAHAIMTKRAKTEEELALEEYQRQLELAIENH